MDQEQLSKMTNYPMTNDERMTNVKSSGKPHGSGAPSLNSARDADPAETNEWVEALDYVLRRDGADRAEFLLAALAEKARDMQISWPFAPNTPYINTIPPVAQPDYPGDREIERRIEGLLRWNAMAMVVRANRELPGIGGHISTYASASTLCEVALLHFLRGRDQGAHDQVFFQPHAAPGIYAWAFLEGRLTAQDLENFRRELQTDRGLSSYPHPWLMPDFWEFPTSSMGLSPIMAIYQARFNRYLHDRGLQDTSQTRVWAFLGDGECDEPEALGALTLAAREQLDNLIFVVNCNLQRLDGPVRGNGKIIQELESVFRGAGWNVIKVIWSSGWDQILADDEDGLLKRRMNEVVDGEYQKYTTMKGSYVRDQFFGKYPELLDRLEKHVGDQRVRILRGGHDRLKVYAAYDAAIRSSGQPTVILAKTVKGFGLGDASEGLNVTHQQKKLDEEDLRNFRDRFQIPIADEVLADVPFVLPAADSPEIEYLCARRRALGGPVPNRKASHPRSEVPAIADYGRFLRSSSKPMSTTMGFVRLLIQLCKDRQIGPQVVPIVPDESRTFGMEGMFRQFGIYSHVGQRYEPVDADHLMYYREAKNGQILEEGITEAGSMSSFIAAGTAYEQHNVNMIPFFVFYSMFGFQRVGDLIWAAADSRAKGFMIGGTAGRTTLNGEGLQHQDGQSLLNAIAFPHVRAYDPAYTYELAVIVLDGIRRLYHEGETAIYYITAYNEPYEMPALPEGAEEGIIRGIYRLSACGTGNDRPTVQLLGSGSLLPHVLEAQTILAERYEISSDVWSVTSWSELRRDARACRRWNMLHPTEPQRTPYIREVTTGCPGPFVAVTDFVPTVAEQLSPYLPGGLLALGTDGLGRSDGRQALRRHFEVDAACIVIAALFRLSEQGELPASAVAGAIAELGVDPEKVDPFLA